MTFRVRSAQQRREEIQLNAERLGIDDAFISDLVETFYTRVRAHPELGPIFENEIGDHWDTHLPKMKDFWSSVATNSGRYGGKPVPAHQKLSGVTASHFNTWLGLFRETLDDLATHEETPGYFMERAERIATSLQLAMFGLPGLPRTGAHSN
jgi:hemoglobin